MFARIRGWVSAHRVAFSFIVAALAIFVTLGSVLILSSGSEQPKSLSWEEQASAVVSVNPLQDYPSSSTAVQEGVLPVEVVSATELLRLSDGENVAAAAMNASTNATALVFASDAAVATPIVKTAYLLPSQLQVVASRLANSGVDVTVVPDSRAGIPGAAGRNPYGATTRTGETGSGVSTLNMFFFGIVALALMFFFLGMIRRMRAGMVAAGASSGTFLSPRGKKKEGEEEDTVPDVSFADVAGCDEAIEEMQELVLFLKEPERFSKTQARPPRGALLVGPPGTGKTLLARAVAGEAGVPFIAAAGSDFVEMYVGMGAKRIRDLFARARKHEEGAIIFIDEIDAVGRKRSSSGSTNNAEHENTLNALLVEMDGFQKSNVIVLAATNRDDILDSALTRAGRLDRKVHVPLPDRAGRERILAVHAAGKPFSAEVDFTLVARRTPGMSGADLAALVNEACLVAARRGEETVTDEDLDAAVATLAMGKARLSAVVTEHDRLVTAWHEAGHTVSAMVLPDADPPVSVSIIPRGPAGGVTWMAQGDDLFLTRRRAFARLVVAMSGRAAEELLLDGEFTSGPHGDLQSATQTALAMVTQYGMTEHGLMTRSEGLLSTGAQVTDEAVRAVEQLLAEALETARETLGSHRELLESVVSGLLEYDTLTLPQLTAIQEGAETVPPMLPPAPRSYVQNKSREQTVFEVPAKTRKGKGKARVVGAFATAAEMFADRLRGKEPRKHEV